MSDAVDQVTIERLEKINKGLRRDVDTLTRESQVMRYALEAIRNLATMEHQTPEMSKRTCPICGGSIDFRVREDEWFQCVRCGWNTSIEHAPCVKCGVEWATREMVDLRGVEDSQPVWKCMDCIDHEECKQCQER
jgi:hypothetical protein